MEEQPWKVIHWEHTLEDEYMKNAPPPDAELSLGSYSC